MRRTHVQGTATVRTGGGPVLGSCRRRGLLAPMIRLGAIAICASTLALDATPADAFLEPVGQFGTQGAASGQFQMPLGVAANQRSGKVYVADSANARVEVFNHKGKFIAAWGWGVKDGGAESEFCKNKTSCQAGIAGSGAGQLSSPTSIAVDSNRGGTSFGDVYVGDAGNNVVVKFDSKGKYLATIDGSTTPQGAFSTVTGVAVDQNGNLWVANRTTNNIDEFDSAGNFIQEWNDGFFSQTMAIAVDATNNAVYLLDDFGATQRFTLSGGGQQTIDMSTTLITSLGLALALNPQTGDLYVDHGDHVVVYDSTGIQIDTVSLGSTVNSQGLAYHSKGKIKAKSAGRRDNLYVSDADNDLVAIYGAPDSGLPLITAASATSASQTSETLRTTIVTLGQNTSCSVQYVDNADFQATGYDDATTVACTPDTLPPSFTYQHASATLTGLTLGDVYHFRIVAMSSAGTTTGNDQTFQAGPGDWAPFFRCPVDDPAMLATDGLNTQTVCIASNSTHGSFTIGATATMTANTNLQFGLINDSNLGFVGVIASTTGTLVADPAQVTVGGINVIATVESAGLPSNFDLFAGISIGAPIVTLPIKIHLTGMTIDLGPSCYIGSDVDPIILVPQNTDLSNAHGKFESFDPDGTPDPLGPLGLILVTGAVQGDDTFAVPAAHGCGPNGDGSLDSTINTVAGLPSPSGANHLVLEDASSAAMSPGIQDGQQVSDAWHLAFD